jgi:PAS domain S-box-containing protein
MQVNSNYSGSQVAVLRWVLPAGFALLSIVYQFGIARFVQHQFGETTHYVIEVLFYGTLGPLLLYASLRYIDRSLKEKYAAENQARTIQNRLASITLASADAIIGVDVSGAIETWSTGAKELFGAPSEEMIGQPFADLFSCPARDNLAAVWAAVLREGSIRGQEFTCVNAREEDFLVELTAVRINDNTGVSLGMSVILRDITQRKRREQEIHRLNASLQEQVSERTRELAEKVEELALANEELRRIDRDRSEFVALVVHQIRAPLTNLKGAITRMQSGCGQDAVPCSRMFNIIDQQASRLDRLVRTVLDAANIEAGEMVLYQEPVSVLPVIQMVADQIRTRKDDRPLRIAAAPGLSLAYADHDRVAEILSNLLDNADKYTPAGNEILIEACQDDHEIRVSIRDHGPGILPRDLENIFEKLYRADSSESRSAYGFGLGLYVCKRLVEAHGGRIWAENAPDEGAIFSFTLPVAV